MDENVASERNEVTIKLPPRHVRLSNANGEPYQITNADRTKSWDAVLCTIPSGTVMNGIDVSGYQFKTFAKKWNAEDVANGRESNVMVRADHDLNLFKYEENAEGEQVRHDMSLDPFKVSKAIKASREEYKAQRNAARKPSPSEVALAARQAASTAQEPPVGQSQASHL